jgi:hypothetical protein
MPAGPVRQVILPAARPAGCFPCRTAGRYSQFSGAPPTQPCRTGQCCQIPASLHCHSKVKPRPLRGNSRQPKFIFFYHCHILSYISGFISCNFYYSYSTQILLLLAVLLLRLWLLLLVSLSLQLLLGSLLMPTSLLLLAFLLLLGCHKLVSDCMAQGHTHGHQFSTNIQILKLQYFLKVAVTTAIWHRWYRPGRQVFSQFSPHSRVASRPCTRPVFRKPAFLKKIWPRKIAGLVTGLEWLGGFECVKKV